MISPPTPQHQKALDYIISKGLRSKAAVESSAIPFEDVAENHFSEVADVLFENKPWPVNGHKPEVAPQAEDELPVPLYYLEQLFETNDFVDLHFIHSTEKWTDDKGNSHSVTRNHFMRAGDASQTTLDYIRKMQRVGFHSYVCMSPLNGKVDPIDGKPHRRARDVAAIRNVYTEIDENGRAGLRAIRDAITRGELPKPHFILQSSPEKFQVIWKVESFDIPQQRALNKAIQVLCGGDPQSVDVVRVLRLAGTFNLKPAYEKNGEYPEVLILDPGFIDPEAPRYKPEDFKISRVVERFDEGAPIDDEEFAKRVELVKKNFDLSGIDHVVRNLLDEYGYVLIDFECPWKDKHTTPGDEVSMFVRKTGFGFKCFHAHCADRHWKPDVRQFIEERVRAQNNSPISWGDDPDALVLNQKSTAQTQNPTQLTPEREAKAAQERAEYEALIDECQREEERDLNPYPIEAWRGTPYYEFAKTCGIGNFIPPQFFIDGMMTTVGAICGNRITPTFNPTLQARFITLFLTKTGGIGKNTIFEWCEVPFEGTGLIRRHTGMMMNEYSRIGCFAGEFGSARGMAEVMTRQPRILQQYGEFSTLVEKFTITGSGDAFRDMVLNAADSQTPNWQFIKGLKVPPDAPKEISNSILAGTTEDRYHEMMAQANWETFVQRMNIVPSDEDRVVFKLVRPDLASFKPVLLPRIQMLETYRLQWDLSPEAERMGEEWFNRMREEIDSEDSEAIGRIQVFIFRIISHMALWLAPAPPSIQIEPGAARPDLVWNYTVGPDIMERALRVAEHQVKARRDCMPVRGTGDAGIIENLIKKWVFTHKSIRWIELRRRSKIARYGRKKCHDALMQVQRTGIISSSVNPDNPDDERDWIVFWVGSKGNHRKWKETRGRKRGGKRINPDTGKGYRAKDE